MSHDQLVLAALVRAREPLCRSEIARRTGIAEKTVSNCCVRLEVSGDVNYLGTAADLGRAERGQTRFYCAAKQVLARRKKPQRTAAVKMPVEIRIAQPRRIPQYHFGAWAEPGRRRPSFGDGA